MTNIKAVNIKDLSIGLEANVVPWQVGIVLTRWYDTSTFVIRRAISDIELAIMDDSLTNIQECADLLGCTIDIERSN